MDSVFSLLNSSDRNSFLRSLLHFSGCSYICLWSYSPHPTNHLFFWDGYLYENNTKPGSSAPTLTRSFFNDYCNEMFFLANGRVPGLAFINNQAYREVNEFDLRTMASIDVQRLFYQEAKIKSAVFMGCRSGEIEMGWSNPIRVNMENSIRAWFSTDINNPNQQSPLTELSQAVDQNRVSSTSSSSLRSFSMESPDSNPLLFNLPSSTSLIPEIVSLKPVSVTSSPQLHQVMQNFQPVDQTRTIRSFHLPNQQDEDEAITQAILAILTSTTPMPNLPQSNRKASAFKKYRAPTSTLPRRKSCRQSMLKRLFTYYRSLNITRPKCTMTGSPNSSQLHHMISERKRREKINESFEALRKLLPPESKKDKASVLTRTREYLTYLKDRVEMLKERNGQLEAQLLLPIEDSSERISVRITHVTESTSEKHNTIKLQVVLRGEYSVADMVLRIVDFLRQDQNVSLMSMEVSALLEESRSANRVISRIRIEGNEWDESAFQEAIKRVVADLL